MALDKIFSSTVAPAVAALLVAAIGGFATGSLNSSSAIEAGYSAAFAQRDDRAMIVSSPDSSKNTPARAVDGSEEYWLRQAVATNSSYAASLERVVWQGPPAADAQRSDIATSQSGVEIESGGADVTRIEVGPAVAATASPHDAIKQASADAAPVSAEPNLDAGPQLPVGHAL